MKADIYNIYDELIKKAFVWNTRDLKCFLGKHHRLDRMGKRHLLIELKKNDCLNFRGKNIIFKEIKF